MSHIPALAIVIVVVVVALILIAMLYVRNYIKVPSNQVAVFTGRGQQRLIRGGAKFKVPGLERVDYMDLTPFSIDVPVDNAYASDGVAIAVKVVALVKFGSSEDLLATATQRWLNADRITLQGQLNEIIAGNMRAVCSTMTVEGLNSNRDQLTRAVSEEAGSALAAIGMELDVLTIQSITDKNGYLEALGRRRVAEVKRDATVGEANANRDSRIQAAQAEQASRVAETESQAAIADAERELALKRATVDSQVQAAQAKAAQSGPQAQAEAEKAVRLAKVEAERAETEAQIAVEQQRAERAQRALQADVVAPAEAARQAAIATAEGERQAVIARAEAEAKQRELAGQADASARKQQASAKQAELEAEANGQKAALLAEAEGRERLAAALNAYGDASQRLTVLPELIKMIPQLAGEIAKGVNIEHLVVMDGGAGSNGHGALERAASVMPTTLYQMKTMLDGLGIDLPHLLQGVLGATDKVSSTPSAAASDTPVPAVPSTPNGVVAQ